MDHLPPIYGSSPPPIGVLLSGGLDSAILVAALLDRGYPVQPFYIRTGTCWEQAELTHARRFTTALAQPRLRPTIEFDLPVSDLYGRHWSLTANNTPAFDSPDEAVFLPGRNALLLIKPAVWCQLHEIRYLALAPLATNPFGDASQEFFRSFTALMACSGESPLEILRPFDQLHKVQVMQLGRNAPLQHTFSCINPRDELHCGRCNKCAERQAAFRDAEILDPTRYATADKSVLAG